MPDQQASADGGASVPEIHPADPGERRRTAVVLILVAICGSLLMLALQHELGAIAERLNAGAVDLAATRFIWLARGAFVLLALVGLITAVVITQGALAVIRERRYPHTGARLLMPRPVTRGDRAVLMGRLGLISAAAFAIVGCSGAVIGWRMLAQFQ
jgi:hypothetical protein